MEIPILVEPVNANGFRARSGEPLVLTVDGATEEEAVRNLSDAIQQRLRTGAKLLSLKVEAPEAPWKALAGRLRDNPRYDAWQQAMAEHRQQVEEGPDLP
jgi:hypothetical protein